MISDDDVGTFLDEVLSSPNLDLFAEKQEAQPALEPGLEAVEGLLKFFHFLPAE
jgi:hypothetical protein